MMFGYALSGANDAVICVDWCKCRLCMCWLVQMMFWVCVDWCECYLSVCWLVPIMLKCALIGADVIYIYADDTHIRLLSCTSRQGFSHCIQLGTQASIYPLSLVPSHASSFTHYTHPCTPAGTHMWLDTINCIFIHSPVASTLTHTTHTHPCTPADAHL